MTDSSILNLSHDAVIERLIDEYELARVTGRKVPSLRRDRKLGQGFPFVKLGSQIRYRLSDVREHIERNLHVAVEQQRKTADAGSDVRVVTAQ